MDQSHDQPLAGTCAKGTLWGAMRELLCTGGLVTGLVMGAVLASIMLVDLPMPTSHAAKAPPYVPAAEHWIEPGAAPHAGPISGLQAGSAADGASLQRG